MQYRDICRLLAGNSVFTHRCVIRSVGQALVVGPRKDAALSEITAYVNSSQRNWLDSWMKMWTFSHALLKRSYTQHDFARVAQQSAFRACDFMSSRIGSEACFEKDAQSAFCIA